MSMISLARASVAERAIDVARHKVIRYKEVAPNVYNGQVKGNYEDYYNVQVNLEHPRSSTCECKFTEGNQRICKHMLAIYYLVNHIDLEQLERDYAYDYDEENEYDYYEFDVYDEYEDHENEYYNLNNQTLLELLLDNRLKDDEIYHYIYSLPKKIAIDELLECVMYYYDERND